MSEPALLPLDRVRALEPTAAAQGVSVVARTRGFTRAYEAAGGDARRLGRAWLAKRRAFIARHVAQAKINGERWWTPGGEPTRRHLALVMWAWSPTRQRLEAYRPSTTARAVGGRSIRAFYDRQVRLARKDIGNPALTLPRLRIEPKDTWGGRFEPAKQPLVFLHPSKDASINRAILVHELSHWVRHHTGDPKGFHDDAFCDQLLGRMYARARIPMAAQRTVEREGGCLAD